MQKFDHVLLASDFDNTLVYTQSALDNGTDIPPMCPRNRKALDYFIQNGGLFAISTGRALPAFARYAKDLIAQGKIGRVYHVNMQYFQAWGLPRANCPLVWRYVKSRTGTGALGDLGSHALDLVRFVTNKEYTRVVGHTGTYVHERPLLDGEGVGKVDVDDFSNYMADMEDEISVSFQITRFAYGRGNYQRMEIYGSEGAIVYSLDATPAGIDEIEVCSGDINADAHVFNHLPIPQQYFSDQMQSFADIVNGTGDGLAANIKDGQANQHLLDAIVESAEKGTWLSL